MDIQRVSKAEFAYFRQRQAEPLLFLERVTEWDNMICWSQAETGHLVKSTIDLMTTQTSWPCSASRRMMPSAVPLAKNLPSGELAMQLAPRLAGTRGSNVEPSLPT